MTKNILIIGANGLIGSSLFNELEFSEFNIWGTSKRLSSNYSYLEITDNEKAWPEFDELDSVVICTGLPNIKECQENPLLSYEVNFKGVEKIISKYKSAKTQIIFISSSHVFNGKNSFVKETEKLDPQNIYGSHKALAEKIVLDNNGLIIRVTKVIYPQFPLFLGWLSKLKNSNEIIAYNNLFASLVPLGSLIDTIASAIKDEWRGVVHLSGPEDKSYDEIATILANKLQYNKKLIISAPGANEAPGIFKVKTTLQVSKIIKNINIYLPNTEQILEDFINDK